MRKVKAYLKKKFYSGKPVSVERIVEQIQRYEVVSFDIFDTLLKRNVEETTDVFQIMQEKVGIANFKRKRIEAERLARQITNKREVTLEDIYASFLDLDNKQRRGCFEAELELERKILTLNLDVFRVYRWCIEHKKDVFIISDMYLPEEFIKDILTQNGINRYKKLYLSCSCDKVKSDGELFKLLLRENNLSPGQIVHIGDSPESDYNQPKKLGIETVKIPRYYKRSEHIYTFNGTLKLNTFNSFLNNTEPCNLNEYQRFGYECFGPFLWGYVRWLYKSIAEREIKKVYFFSRDGLILKKAFDRCFDNANVQTYYLEVSRRSLRVPILWMDCKFETVLDMLSPSKLISLETIFDGIGLNIDEYGVLIKRHGFVKETVFDRSDIMCNQDLLSLYSKLRPDIEANSQKEYELLVKYIRQNQLSGKFAIVDIGWSGGMQRYLEQILNILGIEHEISGYYTGVASYYKRNAKVFPNINLNGYLFDFKNNPKAVDKRSCFVGLFETLFLEHDGSVRNYCCENGIIKAIRYNYEYIIDGKPTEEYEKVKDIQESALEFVSNATSSVLMDFEYSADDMFEVIRKMGANPDMSAIRLFADFIFYDEGEIHKLAEPKSLLFYITHIDQFKNDFLKSRWKTGFMKRILKLKLPYEFMYNFMLRYK